MKKPKKKDNKLYFNKWPYKIECRLVGAHRVKHLGPDQIKAWANSDADDYLWESPFRRGPRLDKINLHNFANAVEPFLNMKETVQVRVENSHFNLFCSDPMLKDQIYNALKKWVIEVHGPATQEELDFLIGNHRKVICNELPYGKFKYKVVIKSWIDNPEVKRKLLNYLVALGEDKVKCSPETIRFLMDQTRYKQDPFFYLVEDKSLTFIRLLTNDIKHVYEYVERDSINTVLQ